MAMVTTERIRNLRDLRMSDRGRLDKAPVRVFNTNEEMISILNELLEYREAEEQSEIQPLFSGMIPLEGTVN